MPIGAARLGFWSSGASISPAVLVLNEGNNIVFSVTSPAASGTMYWTIDSVTGNIDAGDFTGGATSGSVAISNRQGSFTISVRADQKTEGEESFLVNLRTTSTSGPIVAKSKVVVVNDTSLTSYSIVPTSTSISEGQTVTFNVTVTSTPLETFYWTAQQMTGSITTDDVSPLSGSVLVTNNVGSFTITPSLDFVTEGPESFRMNLRTGSTSGPIVATSSTVTISDANQAPVEQFPNAGFEDGLTGWTVLNQRVSLNGGSTILGVPTPADPTPNPVSPLGTSPGDATSFTPTGAGFTYNLDTTDVPPSGQTQSIALSFRASVNFGSIVYGPVVYSNNTVIAETGDKISFWWRALSGNDAGTGDAYNVYAYLVNPSAVPVKYIQLLDANSSALVNTPWAEASVIIQPGNEGNYHFVFVNGGFDATFGGVIGSDLKIDIIKRFRAAQANFLADIVTGPAPLTVIFTDLSIGDELSYQWDFTNDGTVDSTLQNPTHTYTSPGTYAVRLRVFNSFSEDTEIKTAFITVV
jgi:PKD repeat protein